MPTTYEVFDAKRLKPLLDRHRETFQHLHEVENALNLRFYDMDRAVEALILAAVCGEPLLFIGPTGTGKSRLIRVFCHLVGLDSLGGDAQHRPTRYSQSSPQKADISDYFEYLLTPFTEPGELFGYYDIQNAKEGKIIRNKTGMMQTAKVVYLDEIFNGSSAILNSLLTFIQERRFHDRGIWEQVPLQCLFGATNEIPYASEMRAIYDRFTFRCWVDNVTDNATTAMSRPLLEMLRKAWIETYGQDNANSRTDAPATSLKPAASSQEVRFPGLLDELAAFRRQLSLLVIDNNGTGLPVRATANFFDELAQRVDHATRNDLGRMSNRRLVKLLYAMLVHRCYRAVVTNQYQGGLYFTDLEFQLIVYFLDKRDRQHEQQLRFEAGR